MRKLIAIFFISLLFQNLYSQTWQELNQKMYEEFKAGNNKEAIEYGENAIKILENDSSQQVDYGAVLNNLAYIYLVTKNYNKAEVSYNIVLRIIEPVLGKEHKVYARTITYLGEIYTAKRNFEKAETLLIEANRLHKNLFNDIAPEYINSLIKLSKLYSSKQNCEKAIAYQDTVITMTQKESGLYSQYHVMELYNKAGILISFNRSEEAINIFNLILKKQEDIDGQYSNNYLVYLRELGFSLHKVGKYGESINVYKKLCKNTLKAYGETLKFAKANTELGVVYEESGKFALSKKAYEKSLLLIRNIIGEETKEYAQTLNNLAVLLYKSGNYMLAEKKYLDVKDIREKTIGPNNAEYANTLNGLAVLYAESGNLKKAEPFYLRSIKILENNHFKNSPTYFTALTNISELYANKFETITAADYYVKALKVGKKIMGIKNPNYAKLQQKVANFYKHNRLFSMADSLYKEAIKIQEKVLGKNHPDYAITLNNIGDLYIKQKKYSKAEKALKDAGDINRRYFGEYHFQYGVSLNNLAALYYETNNIKKSKSLIIKANEILINQVNNTLSYMTEQESEAFLSKNDYLFDVYNSFYFMQKDLKPQLQSFAYDNALVRKGLMLQSGKSLKRAILKSKNSSLISEYYELLKTKEKLAKLYSTNKQVNLKYIKFLEKQAETQQKTLASNYEIFNSRAIVNSTNWKDIAKNLRPDEAAIEFVHFRYFDLNYTDSVFYCALLLRPEFKYPKMIFLFEEKELSELIIKKQYDDDNDYISNLYHKKNRTEHGFKPNNDTISNKLQALIWQPIEQYLEKVKTIYYSPSGILHNISFSAISLDNNKYLCDKYELNTLLSTRNLINNNTLKNKTNSTITLYGGIDYDVQPEIVNQNSNPSRDENGDNAESRIVLLPSESTRGEQWNYLQGTLDETSAIENLFKKRKINVTSYKGKNAIEENFKQYSNNNVSPTIIHIATHGFFFPNSNTYYGEKNAFKVSDNPLLRSGLLFAGANRSWNNLSMPKGFDDGILTAYEVSNTNLDNTNLVVLSACETGLGEIKGNEGVYGLQRSFKIAGAEHLIMSLWQVPDKQTVELMKSFYNHLSNSTSITEAFYNARNELKQKYLPYYWAAFVLLK